MAIKEEVYFEGGPHVGDLIVNILLGFTVICLPLTVGAVVRALWLRYRISDRRISVTGGWLGRERTDVIYSEVAKIVTVPRGLGSWGDMVITLKDGSRLELRALPRFREVYDYINAKLSARAQQASGPLGNQ
ncbi:PH domain-containing protein [Oculatella sp. LEGE 06141]|uniref:PH domain-containing protein n=1 Tax=Oculatella sp. LEGE 06141 TaxID=1828648 RepID=UPI0018808BD1|nr:PH domain-containing protein [Oculatella sp. LEGE 06141]MBE9177588.1 PH domain-containing protein [Oculatella sp. LEGE 06141]